MLVFGPAVELLRRLDLVFAEGFTVRGGGVLLCGCSPRNVRIEDDEVGPCRVLDSLPDRALEKAEIIGI